MAEFGRAMQALDIEIIPAHTPQAKGRVERANDTLQDRLVKELRLQNISTIQAANTFAPEYLPGFNRCFALQPRSNQDTHRPQLFSETELDQIFSLQETRTLSKNLTLPYKKVLYQVQTSRVTYALRKAQVTVCENPTGQVSILYKGKPMNSSIFHKQQRQAEVRSRKEIFTLPKKPYQPPQDHPWRQFGKRLSGNPIQQHTAPHGTD